MNWNTAWIKGDLYSPGNVAKFCVLCCWLGSKHQNISIPNVPSFLESKQPITILLGLDSSLDSVISPGVSNAHLLGSYHLWTVSPWILFHYVTWTSMAHLLVLNYACPSYMLGQNWKEHTSKFSHPTTPTRQIFWASHPVKCSMCISLFKPHGTF